MQQQPLQDRTAATEPARPAPDGVDVPGDNLYGGVPGGAAPRTHHSHVRASPPALVERDTRTVLLTAGAATAVVVTFDLALTQRLSMFFDLCFVLVGLSAALVVKRPGFFAVGVLPPLLLGAVVAVLAVVAPSALTASHLAFVSTWLTGLAHHGAALVATHAVVLAIIGLRLPQTSR